MIEAGDETVAHDEVDGTNDCRSNAEKPYLVEKVKSCRKDRLQVLRCQCTPRLVQRKPDIKNNIEVR